MLKKIVIICIFVLWKVVALGEDIRVNGHNILNITCAKDLNYYKLSPLAGNYKNTRTLLSRYESSQTGIKQALAALKKQRIYMHISSGGHYVKQTDICKLPSGVIKTEMWIGEQWFKNKFSTYDPQIMGADIKIWLNDELVIDIPFGAYKPNAYIKSIIYNAPFFSIFEGNDRALNDEHMIDFLPTVLEETRKRGSDNLYGRICVNFNIDKNRWRLMTFNLPITQNKIIIIKKFCQKETKYDDIHRKDYKTDEEYSAAKHKSRNEYSKIGAQLDKESNKP